MSAITFNDVLFEPQYSEINSRSDVDVSTNLGVLRLTLPVISSNMKDITGPEMVKAMYENGGFGILHRFEGDYVQDFRESISLLVDPNSPTNQNIYWNVGVSVGVQEQDKDRFLDLLNEGAKVFCIDVAHGHHVKVRNMLEFINNSLDHYATSHDRSEFVIIAGNVATAQGAKDLFKWGATAIKCGIGGGSVCQTRNNTGVGVPQLQALMDIRAACPYGKIISDGGIKTTGDIAKALKYADAVMVASMIAGTTETPGHVYENPNGEFYKVFGGSASGERKVENGGKKAFVEGMVKTVPFRGKVKFILRNIRQSLQSSFSYAGANNLLEFQRKAVLKTISGGGKSESKMA